jgi:hypothetical protein
MGKPKLPQRIYVARYNNNENGEDLLAWRDPFNAADDEKKEVGIYELVETKVMQKILDIR